MFASLSSALRTFLFISLALCTSLSAQAATMGQLPFIPTRFHLCSVELDDVEGDAREEEMRACLSARFHAERLIRSQCSQQVKQTRPAPRNADERYRAQRDCFIQHLTQSYKDLPQNNKNRSDSAARSRAVNPAQPPAPTQVSSSSTPSDSAPTENTPTSAVNNSPSAVPPAAAAPAGEPSP